MKVKDITVGEVYGLDHTVPGIKKKKMWPGIYNQAWPKIKTVKKVKVLEILPKGRAIVEESWVTWDRWMMDKDKKAITKTKTYEVGTRKLVKI